MDNTSKEGFPEYIYEANDMMRRRINSECNFTDNQSKIFELICNLARDVSDKDEHILTFTDAWKRVLNHGQKYLIREFHNEVNAQLKTREVIERLNNFHYAQLIEGTIENLVSFTLIKPANFEPTVTLDKSTLEFKGKIIQIVKRKFSDLKLPTKLYPSRDRVVQTIRMETPGFPIDVKAFDKCVKKINVNEFVESFIQKESTSGDLLEITFDDASSILIPADSLNELLSIILVERVKTHLGEDIGFKEKMKLEFSKKNREVPLADSVFANPSEENSFEWISVYYSIIKSENQRLRDKRTNYNYRCYFQTASLLYSYFLNKRESFVKEKAAEQQYEKDCRQLEKQMIKDHDQAWTVDKMVNFLNSISPLKVKYSAQDIKNIINIINQPAVKINTIPNILAIKIQDNLSFIHKFRFILFFFNQQKIESSRLKQHYIEAWSEDPAVIPDSESKFDADLWENISRFFSVLVRVVIPYLFKYPHPDELLVPDEIMTKDQAAYQKFKQEYNLFIRSVFTRSDFSAMKSLPQILTLNLDEIKKEALYERKGSMGLGNKLFGWFTKLLEIIFTSGAVREQMRIDVLRVQKEEDPISGFNKLLMSYKEKKEITAGQLNYLRKLISTAKKEFRDVKRMEKQKEKSEEKEKLMEKKQQLQSVKEYFLEGRSYKDVLDEYSKRAFLKLEQARKDSEESVRGSINAYFRKYKGRTTKCTVDSIQSYAKAIVKNNERIFDSIKDKDALTNYIEIVLVGAFIRRYDK